MRGGKGVVDIHVNQRCETPDEPHAATHALHCRRCGGVSFACAEHIEQAREHFSDPLIVAIHTPCGARALDLDGLFVVVPL